MGIEGNLLINYFNPFTKSKFKKRVYYDNDYVSTEVVWTYGEDQALTSICNIYWEAKLLEDGTEVVETINDCIHFDKNGCMIKK